jgi:hypothetical protein
MSNILSLEELNEVKKRCLSDMKLLDSAEHKGSVILGAIYTCDIIGLLCETAIERYRKWKLLVDGLNNLDRYDNCWGDDMVPDMDGRFLYWSHIKKLLEQIDK